MREAVRGVGRDCTHVWCSLVTVWWRSSKVRAKTTNTGQFTFTVIAFEIDENLTQNEVSKVSSSLVQLWNGVSSIEGSNWLKFSGFNQNCIWPSVTERFIFTWTYQKLVSWVRPGKKATSPSPRPDPTQLILLNHLFFSSQTPLSGLFTGFFLILYKNVMCVNNRVCDLLFKLLEL